MVHQGFGVQVPRQLAAQVDPRRHHELSQLGGSGGGLLLERLREKGMKGFWFILYNAAFGTKDS